MSIFSGKCDLCDHISGMGGWFDKDGNPVKFNDPNVRALYSDEWLDFLAFKKATGGVMHQHKKITLTPWNHEEIKKLCKNFDYQEHTRTVPDKRNKTGQREEKYLTYTYWGKKYTLKELNKKDIWITIDIHFDTLLDLIPYYPYIVSMCSHSSEKEVIYISDQSFVDEERDDHLKCGWYSDFWQYYKKELQDHYRDIVLEYFNPEGREVVEDVEFTLEEVKEGDTPRYIAWLHNPIDSNFYVEWRWEDNQMHTHWTSPKVIDYDQGIIEMSKQDYESFIGNKVMVKYVKQKDHKLNLG